MKKQIILFTIIPFLLLGCNGKEADSGEEISITLDQTSIVLSEEKTYQLTPTVTGTNKTITWSSRDEVTASVSQDGLVTALQEGKTQIVATIDDAVAVCSLKVTPFQPDDALHLTIEKVEYTLYANDEPYEINYSLMRGEMDVKDEATISYSFSNEGIVSINNNVITGLTSGETYVTMTASYYQEQSSEILHITII